MTIQVKGGPVYVSGIPYNDGDMIVVSLKQYEVLYTEDTDGYGMDTSGSEIVSDKPVSVFGGSFLAEVAQGSADHLLEQILPYALWGEKFFLVGTPGRYIGDIFRLMAAEDGTTVTMLPENTVILLNAVEYKDLDIDSETFHILQSDKPIQVYLYSKSYDSDDSRERDDLGDPSMAMVPPISQYINRYVYSTMEGYFDPFTYYATVVIPGEDASIVSWNSQLLTERPDVTFHSVDILGDKFVVATFSMPYGTQDIFSRDATKNVMVWASGISPWNSYGTVAGGRSVRFNDVSYLKIYLVLFYFLSHCV